MRLHIRHATTYEYGEAVKHSVQSLRLTPRRESWQRAITWQIAAPGRRSAQIDAHGNVVHLLTVDEPHHEIRIVVEGLVETDDVPREAFPNDGPLSPLAYLSETALTQTNDGIRDFARGCLPAGVDRAAGFIRLAHAVSDLVAYRPGATEVGETAAKAFARREGVCQDHAHVFIACCRATGIPARYVSGYLYAARPEASVQENIASHAWVDAWLGDERGWMSIDVTNRAVADGRHCRLALGRDYLDACPVRGVRRGGGLERMSVDVRVDTSPHQQQQQQ